MHYQFTKTPVFSGTRGTAGFCGVDNADVCKIFVYVIRRTLILFRSAGRMFHANTLRPVHSAWMVVYLSDSFRYGAC